MSARTLFFPAMADPKIDPTQQFEDLLREDRTFAPPAEFRAQAVARATSRCTPKPNAIPKRSGRDLPRSWNGPGVGTRCSTGSRHTRSGSSAARSTRSVNCLDRHLRGPRRNKAALIWEGEPGDRRTLTYFDLHRQVSTFATVLKALGIKKGDRVAIYLPLVPSSRSPMLACARIGAIHSVVFGGFSAESLRDRINDSAMPPADYRRRRLPARSDRRR